MAYQPRTRQAGAGCHGPSGLAAHAGSPRSPIREPVSRSDSTSGARSSRTTAPTPTAATAGRFILVRPAPPPQPDGDQRHHGEARGDLDPDRAGGEKVRDQIVERRIRQDRLREQEMTLADRMTLQMSLSHGAPSCGGPSQCRHHPHQPGPSQLAQLSRQLFGAAFGLHQLVA